jgi:RimJ/RimL family protein N-acetyltransferase
MTLCDGRGAWRVLLRLLADERGHDGEAVRLRLAERADSDLMFAWQSLPEVRRYARHPEMPSRAEHDAWVEPALASPERVLTLILHGGAPVGVLRFDRLDAAPSYEISILVDPRLHGRGVAAAALRLGQTLLRGATLHAEVDPANAASVQLFRGAGFQAADGRRLIWSNGREPAPRASEAHAAAEVIP